MRFLGIDYGEKRIGLALSDEGGKIAFPKEIIENNLDTVDKIGKILKEKNVGQIVIGDSVNAQGEANIISNAITSFSEEIGKKFQLPVHKEKEFFSSFEAHGRMGKEVNSARQDKFAKTEDVDAKAAAVILQRYLDRVNK
jgi:putative holliday junction resolvase